jgi:hypothetical protein
MEGNVVRNCKLSSALIRAARLLVLNDCSSTSCDEASEAIDARKAGKKK